MEMCTAQGHVVGMLDRDQRTAKLCTFDRRVVTVKECEGSQDQTVIAGLNKTISHRSVPGRTSPHSSCKTRKNGHFWKSLHRLKHALIVGTYLSLVTFPSILSAPTDRSSMSSEYEAGNGHNNGVSDAKLVELIVNQVRIVKKQAMSFKDEYIAKVQKMNVDQWKDHHYDWLPVKELNLHLGGTVAQDHLDSLELSTTLKYVFTTLQKIGVGIEQIVGDEPPESAFKKHFEELSYQLRRLLCEVQEVMIEKNVVSDETFTKDIMGDKLIHVNETTRLIRNWIIYRDYLIMLEYMDQVFQHFNGTLSG